VRQRSAGLAATSSPPAQTATTPAASRPSSPAAETAGSFRHTTDEQFYSTHQCYENFSKRNGYIVQCVDGGWSHLGWGCRAHTLVMAARVSLPIAVAEHAAASQSDALGLLECQGRLKVDPVAPVEN
jgi:hypothetical protein